MKTWVAITDLTRMQGKRVCLAGYKADCSCVRPVFRRPNGLTEDWLQASSQGIIRPFAVVEFDLSRPIRRTGLSAPFTASSECLTLKANGPCWSASKTQA